MAGKKKYPKVKCQVLRWWSHGGSMVAPNYPHCPTPSGHGCQSDIPKSGGRGTTSMKQDHQPRSSEVPHNSKAKRWWWLAVPFIQAGHHHQSKGPWRAQRVEWGRPSYLDITRQNVKILQSRQTKSGFFQKTVAPVLSGRLLLNEIHAWPF